MGQRDDLIASMKSVVVGRGTDLVMGAIAGAGFFAQRLVIPFVFLAMALVSLIPGVSEKIIGMGIRKILEKLVELPELGVFFLYTDLRVDKQGEKVGQAALDYWKTSEGKDRVKFDQAEAELKNSLRPFIDLRG